MIEVLLAVAAMLALSSGYEALMLRVYPDGCNEKSAPQNCHQGR